jgi:hypothetical protein
MQKRPGIKQVAAAVAETSDGHRWIKKEGLMALHVLGSAGVARKGRSAAVALRHGYYVVQHERKIGRERR